MLHELLLHLATHISGLFTSNDDIQPFLLNVLHPAERQLLQKLHLLSLQYRFIRQIITFFSSYHYELRLYHRILVAILMELQRLCYPLMTILIKLEEKVIKQDSRLIGLIKYNTIENTYNLTSISLIEIEYILRPWFEKMKYLEYIGEWIDKINTLKCLKLFLKKLSEDKEIYNNEIGILALKLLCAGQKGWVDILLPLMLGIINNSETEELMNEFEVFITYLPDFVSITAANDIFLNGQAMRRLQDRLLNGLISNDQLKNSLSLWPSIIYEQTTILSSLKYPLSTSSFELVVKQIKGMCIQHVFKHVLSLEMINALTQLLCDYYLLQYSEFVFYFLREVSNKQKIIKMSKQTQISILLIRTFKELAHFEENCDINDTTAILNRQMLSLLISKDTIHNTSFSDLLIGIPIVLSFTIPWPLTLFFFEKDVKNYSSIFSYLIAIKYAQTLLSDLWRKRRCINATPKKINRSHWAMASYVLYFLDGLWEYFQTTVIQIEYQKFTSSFSNDFNYDPEFLQTLYQQFLSNLTKKLFLKNDLFLTTLKKIILSVNLIVSVINSSINDYMNSQEMDDKLIKGFIKQILRIIEAEHTDIDSKLINYLLLRLEF
ncbi:hypothetical protein PCANB_002136 [Pneumocystis canis]|nr:hypothetical protein PCK1_001763 [Pneumocystis canis]KAG5439560.1 hypothetical protein PCANB_002136 [Pneumocystis canis]